MVSNNLLFNKILQRVRGFGNASGKFLEAGAAPTTRTIGIGQEMMGNFGKIVSGQRPQFSYPQPGLKGALSTAGDVLGIAGTAAPAFRAVKPIVASRIPVKPSNVRPIIDPRVSAGREAMQRLNDARAKAPTETARKQIEKAMISLEQNLGFRK